MNLPPVLKQQYFTASGDPLAGGKLYTYQANTTTPQQTYTDASGVTPNTNPIILDANGEADMWLDPTFSYKFVLDDADDVLRWSVDNVVGTLTNDAVGTNTIQDGAVTTPKIADGAITPAKISSQLFGPFSLSNYSLQATVLANDLIIALRDGTGAAPSALTAVQIPFRDPSATTGTPVFRTVTSAITATVSSGSTLGSTSNRPNWIYVYALDNGGAVELAFSASNKWDEGSLQDTVADGGGGSADSADVLYANNARSGKAIRLIGRIKSTQTVAGTWAAAPSEISLVPFELRKPALIASSTASPIFITADTPIIWDNILYNSGDYDAGTGIFTAPSPGLYIITGAVQWSGGTGFIYKNGVATTYLIQLGVGLSGQSIAICATIQLAAGDAIFVGNSVTGSIGGSGVSHMGIAKILDL